MLLKCGRVVFDLTEDDVILFNGVAYILMTRRVGQGYSSTNPMVSKVTVNKLIRNGSLREVRFKNPPYEDKRYKYYKIAKSAK